MDRYGVASVGLDLLDQTRLRLACSLLLAEKLNIRLVQAQENPDLYVLGVDQAEGKELWRKSQKNNKRVILVAQNYQGGAPWVAHGATVREFREVLHRAIVHETQGVGGNVYDHPIILKEILAPSFVSVKHFRMRSLECLIDSRSRYIYLTDNADISEFLGLIRSPGWTLMPSILPDEEVPSLKFPKHLSFESVIFGLSGSQSLSVSNVKQDQYVKLRLWPELIPETISSIQLMAIARLHSRSWKPQSLADACNLSLQTVLGIFAAATECGLLVVDENPVDEAPSQPLPQTQGSRFLVWVARRFGLKLSKE